VEVVVVAVHSQQEHFRQIIVSLLVVVAVEQAIQALLSVKVVEVETVLLLVQEEQILEVPVLHLMEVTDRMPQVMVAEEEEEVELKAITHHQMEMVEVVEMVETEYVFYNFH
jgi:hypothetical protein